MTSPHDQDPAGPTRRVGRGRARRQSPVPDAICRATEALLEEARPERLTVTAILLRSGTRRTSFYHWFASKDDVLAELLERVADELDAQLPAVGPQVDLDPALRTALDAAFGVWERHGPLLAAAQAHPTTPLGANWSELVERRWVEPLAAWLREDGHGGRAAAPVDPLALARSLCAMTAQALRAHVSDPAQETARAAARDALVHVWARSLAAAPAGRRPR